jgi:hypothetical protein
MKNGIANGNGKARATERIKAEALRGLPSCSACGLYFHLVPRGFMCGLGHCSARSSTVAKLVEALKRSIPEGTEIAERKKEALRLARELLRGTKYEEE